MSNEKNRPDGSESPCWGCKWHDPRQLSDPRRSRCDHPYSMEMINIPGLIDDIFNGMRVTPSKMKIIVVNEIESDGAFEFPVNFNPEDISICQSKNRSD